MQRKNFPLGEGGWGEEGSDEGSEEGSEEKSCENFLSILTFSREKSVLTKVVPYDARSFKKIGSKLSQNGGGGLNPKCDNYRTFFFFTLTPSINNFLSIIYLL